MTTPRWTKSVYVKLILAILVILCIFTFVLLNNSYKFFGSNSISSSTTTSVNSGETVNRTSSNLKTLVESWMRGKSNYSNFFSITSFRLAFRKRCCRDADVISRVWTFSAIYIFSNEKFKCDENRFQGMGNNIFFKKYQNFIDFIEKTNLFLKSNVQLKKLKFSILF